MKGKGWAKRGKFFEENKGFCPPEVKNSAKYITNKSIPL
jgi:hypothetical protein